MPRKDENYMGQIDSYDCPTFVCSLLRCGKGFLVATRSNFYPVCRFGNKLNYLAWTQILAAALEVGDE